MRAAERLKHALARARGTSVPEAEASADAATEAAAALHTQLKGFREELRALTAQAAEADGRIEHLLALERDRVQERASLAAIPRAKLLSTSIDLEGTPSQRLGVRRVRVGEPVERPFSTFLGVTQCATDAADVRDLWARLLASETQCGEDVLRGLPSTILDVPDATISIVEGGRLNVALGRRGEAARTTVAVPRCTFDFPPQKLRNFGHWLLDCAPQVVALWKAAPDAQFLLPDPGKGFHQATLSLLGIPPHQLKPWDGAPLACSRVLVFESDGRTGGGRPLSALVELRRLMAPPLAQMDASPNRRVYLSRRDAGSKRQWVTNEAEVEALFRSRGFEILLMADCPLEQQVRIFREARIVAGVSGAALSDLVFAPAGTHAVVLTSDSLIRWYANEGGARSLWSAGRRVAGGQLAALGDSPRFYAHLCATFEQYCHSFVAGDQMPVGRLAGFLDDVIARVDHP